MIIISQSYKFQVEMTCEGCSGAINRILTRQKGKFREKVVKYAYIYIHL